LQLKNPTKAAFVQKIQIPLEFKFKYVINSICFFKNCMNAALYDAINKLFRMKLKRRKYHA